MKIMFKIKKYFLLKKYNTLEKKQLPMYKLSFLELQKQYNLIDDYTYEIETHKVINSNLLHKDFMLKELEINKKYNKVSEIEYVKQKNDILRKPFVAIHTNYDEQVDPNNMEIEVVYNNTFIDKMKKKGYVGTDEEIAEQWLKLFFISNFEED